MKFFSASILIAITSVFLTADADEQTPNDSKPANANVIERFIV